MLTRRAFLAASLIPALRGQNQKEDLFTDAEAYERFMGRWSRLMAFQLVDFTGVADRGRVLDVGSGTGALSFALAEKKPQAHIVGIDPAKGYVAYANSKNRFRDLASFQVGDAQQLPF